MSYDDRRILFMTINSKDLQVKLVAIVYSQTECISYLIFLNKATTYIYIFCVCKAPLVLFRRCDGNTLRLCISMCVGFIITVCFDVHWKGQYQNNSLSSCLWLKRFFEHVNNDYTYKYRQKILKFFKGAIEEWMRILYLIFCFFSIYSMLHSRFYFPSFFFYCVRLQ